MKINRPVDLKEKLPEGYVPFRKWDGVRCHIIHNDIMLADKKGVNDGTIGKRSLLNQFPELKDMCSKIPKDTIFDGELVCTKGFTKSDFVPGHLQDMKGEYEIESFETANGRAHLTDSTKISVRSKSDPAIVKVFDTLQYEGRDVTELDLFNEKKVDFDISTYGRFDLYWRFGWGTLSDDDKKVEYYQFDPHFQKCGKLNTILMNMMSKYWEGMIWKPTKGSYHAKWYKTKNWEEHDFKVTGYTSGKRDISALTLDNGSKVNANPVLVPANIDKSKIPGSIAVVRYLSDRGIPANVAKGLRFPVLKELRLSE